MERPESPALTPGAPDKPGNLSAGASGHWDRLIDEMERSGVVLIPGDRAIVSMAAKLMADLDTAWGHIQADGRYTVSKTGVQKLHPAVDDTARLNEKLARVLWQLGLTPRSRSNGPVNPTERKERTRTLDDVLAPPDADGNTYEVIPDGEET